MANFHGLIFSWFDLVRGNRNYEMFGLEGKAYEYQFLFLLYHLILATVTSWIFEVHGSMD